MLLEYKRKVRVSGGEQRGSFRQRLSRKRASGLQDLYLFAVC